MKKYNDKKCNTLRKISHILSLLIGTHFIQCAYTMDLEEYEKKREQSLNSVGLRGNRPRHIVSYDYPELRNVIEPNLEDGEKPPKLQYNAEDDVFYFKCRISSGMHFKTGLQSNEVIEKNNLIINSIIPYNSEIIIGRHSIKITLDFLTKILMKFITKEDHKNIKALIIEDLNKNKTGKNTNNKLQRDNILSFYLSATILIDEVVLSIPHDVAYLLKIFGFLYLRDNINVKNFPIQEDENNSIFKNLKKIQLKNKKNILESISIFFYDEIKNNGNFSVTTLKKYKKYYWSPLPVPVEKHNLEEYCFDFNSGMNIIFLSEHPSVDSLNSIKKYQLGLFAEDGKLYCKVSGKDQTEITVDENAVETTQKGLPRDIFDKIMGTVTDKIKDVDAFYFAMQMEEQHALIAGKHYDDAYESISEHEWLSLLQFISLNGYVPKSNEEKEKSPRFFQSTMKKTCNKKFMEYKSDISSSEIEHDKKNDYLNTCLLYYKNLQGDELKNYKIREKIEDIKLKTTLSINEDFQLPKSFCVPKYDSDTDQFYAEPENKYVSILSLDGGGFRGLMEAYWLDHLENVTKRPIYQMFDLIAGTSIGGILAMATTIPSHQNDKIPVLSTKDMIDLFVNNGEKIFPQRKKYNVIGKTYDSDKNILWSRYPEAPLEEMLVSYFGNRRLRSALTNIIVTSMTTEQRPFLFSSFDGQTQDYMVFEAARATSAAPSYFEAFPLILPGTKSKKYLVDGGMWQNNPAKLACEQALKWGYQQELRFSQDHMIMLSLGTGKMPIHIQPTNSGFSNTLFPALESFMNIPSEGIHESLESMLGKNYRRINPNINKNIELDSIGSDNIVLLQEAAKTKYDDIEEFATEGSLRLILEQSDKK